MGVEAHRVMMTWLMHEILSTADLKATEWDEFNRTFAEAKVFKTQNIVRAATDDRFTCFSWSQGLQSYTGYIAANSTDKNKIIVPFRANNTGNFLGWYEVDGKKTNATPVVSGNYKLQGNSYVMNGELNTNDAALNNRFAIFSTPGNAVIYLDYVRARTAATITAEKGGLMAISVDELTKTKRALYTTTGHKQLDGSKLTVLSSPWVNIDNVLGIVTFSETGTYKKMAFGERANNNSVMTAKLYTLYDNSSRTYKLSDVVDRRAVVYYSNTTAEGTGNLFAEGMQLTTVKGWNGAIAADPDSTRYLLLSNFIGDKECKLSGIITRLGCPVFTEETTITKEGASATFTVEKNYSAVNTLKFFIQGDGVTAVQEKNDSTIIYVRNDVKGKNVITVNAADEGKILVKEIELGMNSLKLSIKGGELLVEEAETFPGTTGINNVRAERGANAITDSADNNWYDLQGRELTGKPANAGIYMHKGRKLVRK